jgi:uncharacterized protein (DUF2141 family)
MNLFKLFCFSVVLTFFLSFKATENHFISVSIKGLKNNNGTVYISLFNAKEGFPENHLKALRTSAIKIINNSTQITFSNLPKGEYAIACFHDENENKKLDTNMFGYPVESFGASNNAKGTLGPPSFENAKIKIDKNTTHTITVN